MDKTQNSKYHICLNKDCDIIYFNYDQSFILKADDMKTPIWFKKDANPKYICYCNNVTEEQIIYAILHQNAKNMNDIIKITGAMKNGECETKNPLGKCCGPVIQEVITNTLNKSKA